MLPPENKPGDDWASGSAARMNQQSLPSNGIVIVIPARSGSKRIPNKNVKSLGGKPMIAYTIEAALQSGIADRVIVTTDSGQISMIAVEYGAEIIRRPSEISDDTAPVDLALIHALENLAEKNSYPGYVLTLQPSSPLRSVKTIHEFVDAYFKVSDRYDSMISVHQHPGTFWVQTGNENLHPMFPDSRENQPTLYQENNALCITRTSSLIETKSRFGNSVAAYVIDPVEGIEVIQPSDLAWAELQLKLRKEADQPKASTRPLIPF